MIEDEYDQIVEELAERAKLKMEEGETDKMKAIRKAIDEGLYYMYDEAIVLAEAYLEGYISLRSGTLNWDAVLENLIDDIEIQMISNAK